MRHAGGLAVSLFVIAGSVSASAAPLPRPEQYSYPSHSGSRFEVDLRFFHDQLSPYGDWLSEPDWGPVWVPHRVSSGWRPYTVGHWAWTDDYGWFWVSDEPYGWATCHYGRWYPSARYGWVWVPGYDWSPAWVTFRSGGGYSGWAPLPPEFVWDAGVGFRVGDVGIDVALNRYVDPRAYTFVQDRWFLDPVQRHAVPVNGNDRILVETRDVTDYRTVNAVPVNRGIPVERIQGVVNRPVPRARVVDVDTVAAARRAPASGAVQVFRPAVSGTRETIATRGAAVVERRPSPQVIEQRRRQEAAHANAQREQQAEQQRQAQQRATDRQRQDAQRQQEQQAQADRQHARQQAQAERQRTQQEQRQREQQAQADKQRAQQAQAERQHAQQQAQADRRRAQQQAQAERQHAEQHAQQQQRAQQAQQSRQQQLAQERQQAQTQQRQQQARQKREQNQKKPPKSNPNDHSKENQS